MIIVKLWGGLGNQMFQYAFGLYLAEQRGESPLFFSDIANPGQTYYDIEALHVEIQFCTDRDLKKIGYHFSNEFQYRLKRKLIQSFPFLNNRILVEKGLHYLPQIDNNYVLFDGYWQSYKYLEPIENKLRKIYTVRNSFLNNSILYNQIKNSLSIGVHIRAGDFLSGKPLKLHGAFSSSYYQKAIIELKKRYNTAIFYIFSNDLEWARRNLELPENIKLDYVDNSELENPAIADLFMMAGCKHQIIANSTFSWWAAWLNQNPEKTVICPQVWYPGKLNNIANDLLPPQWIRM